MTTIFKSAKSRLRGTEVKIQARVKLSSRQAQDNSVIHRQKNTTLGSADRQPLWSFEENKHSTRTVPLGSKCGRKNVIRGADPQKERGAANK